MLTDWDNRTYTGGLGVLVGCNACQEWMLKWWWENYSKHNSFSVTFIDFGMSKSARLWCEMQGNVIPLLLPPNTVKLKEELPLKTQKLWEKIYGAAIWKARVGWCRKAFAFLKTPYDSTLWLDLDCQVLKPLNSIFHDTTASLAMALEKRHSAKELFQHKLLYKGELLYNTGVVLFQRHCPIIPKWAKKTLTENHLFIGDQDILSRIIYKEKFPLALLPSIYNHHLEDGLTPDTHILHFVCSGGKHSILKNLNF